ncbi:DUF4129 domain-containing protein [Flavobacterium salilacus subsp. salilacus]|uniref:DUF4129 domain-containing protein n=1 Tax=Flavobacterium TaxID=237 RepID=UPI0010758A3B|nr:MULTISPECIES: DUF4129 domain-containing protein [Flavobacterium]KAF2516889.1 DUF4129 domain-containing protein [Flavobacterium salilacus subsp. salilacus]MBE1615751.1 DUF4129 domain-containing protein [Flavobacterium sp. SaA2.13]
MNKKLIYLLLLAMPMLYAAPAIQTDTVTEAATIAPIADTATVYTQREFRDNFKESYTDNDFQYETKTQAKNAWDRFWEAVGNFFRNLFNTGEKSEGSGIGTLLTYLIAGAIVVFAVYMIVRAILNKESVWIFGKSRKNIVVQNIDGEDIHQMDFPAMIEETIQQANYRLAIRYYYLWLLKELSEREIIQWHYDKTNSDYAYEIKKESLKKQFEYLSYVYDYSWYGEFPINETAFTKVRKAFRETLNTL